jgi:high-affinity iron transporter
VLEGVALGGLFTAAVGVLTFVLHQRLPYKKLLIATGAMLVVVLFVMVGEEVNEMQLAGWIPTTSIGVDIPGWAGQWFSLFPNVETIVAQASAVTVVLGSYVAWHYLRVWRPRRRATVQLSSRGGSPKSGKTRSVSRKKVSSAMAPASSNSST